jgi:fatty acid desaturase
MMSHLNIKQARILVADLFRPTPWIYWADFLFSLSVAYGTSLVVLKLPAPLAVKAVCFATAAVSLYRVSLFMHEIAHLPAGQMRGFKVAWNILAGIPLMLPSFFYDTHREHHNTRHYGTEEDGEYLPLANGTWLDLAGYFAQALYLPLITFFRHLVVTPISLLYPPLRRWVWQHWSSFVIDLSFQRQLRPSDPVALWTAMEIACHLRAALLVFMLLSGIDPWYNALILYGLSVSILAMNHFRTLAAHRYASQGHLMSLEEQLTDSVDLPQRDWLTLALCPVGLRFHALHHLFPGMPYHNLETAHQRLMAQLPAAHPYRQSVAHSMREVIAALLQQIRSNSRAARAVGGTRNGVGAASRSTGQPDGTRHHQAA